MLRPGFGDFSEGMLAIVQEFWRNNDLGELRMERSKREAERRGRELAF